MCVFVLAAGLAPVAGASPQQLQWLDSAGEGAAKAKETRWPLLFLVPRSDDDDEREVRIPEAFRDPIVSRIISEGFIAVRLRPSTTTQVLLKQLNSSNASPHSIVVATPAGRRVGAIAARDVADAAKLAEGLTELARAYRVGVYERDLKPAIEEPSASWAGVAEALQVVRSLRIAEADAGVAALLGRDDLDADIRGQIYTTLALLSTERAANALLDAAAKDEAAAAALAKCTPAGAEFLLQALDLERPDRLALAYAAIAKICAVEQAKPREFWDRADERARFEEIERIRKVVPPAAATWRKEHGVRRLDTDS
jgi:hypothetical protein